MHVGSEEESGTTTSSLVFVERSWEEEFYHKLVVDFDSMKDGLIILERFQWTLGPKVVLVKNTHLGLKKGSPFSTLSTLLRYTFKTFVSE